MGFILHAFIGKEPDLILLANSFRHSKLNNVGEEIFIIPMTEELYDELNEFKISVDVGNLTYMSQHVEKRVLGIIGDSCIGYIEAEYSGGQGGQTAVLWQNGGRYRLYDLGQGVINILLKHFGVSSGLGLDEFDTINLGRHRNTEDWLNPNK